MKKKIFTLLLSFSMMLLTHSFVSCDTDYPKKRRDRPTVGPTTGNTARPHRVPQEIKGEDNEEEYDE